MGAKMMSRGTKKHKSREKITLEKNIKNATLQKVGYCLPLGGVREGSFRAFFRNDPKNPQNASPGLQNESPGLQNYQKSCF